MVLTWYIFRQCFVTLIMTSLAIIGIVWLGQTLRLVELLVNKGALFIDFVNVTMAAIPFWLLIILPISATISTTIVLSRMQQDKELIAMTAAGISPLRIGSGPMLMGGVITLFLILNSAFIIPMTYSYYKTVMANLRAAAPIVVLQAGVFTDINKGLTIYINEKESENVFQDIFIHDERNPDATIEIHAEKATVSINDQAPIMYLFNGIRTEFTDTSKKAVILEFDTYQLNIIESTSAVENRPKDYHEMSIPALLFSDIGSGQYKREMRAEGHFRITAPLIGLSLIMMVLMVFMRSRYQRSQYWKQISIITFLTLITEVALITSRSLTVEIPSLFPLMYLVALLPLFICYILTWQPWIRKAQPV
ncbi:MAG: LptF/LptG family permease [Candidatus Puniceispirillales bacterium]